MRSSRLLEAEGHRNVEVLGLTGKQTPDFKTLADFRKDNWAPLQAVARQFTLLCRKRELFGGELLAMDGRKFRAVNARDPNDNAGRRAERIAPTDARRMPAAPGNGVGSNAPRAVDAKPKLIAADDVTHEVNDRQPLATVALTAQENLGFQQAEVVADKGYYSAHEVSRCVEHGITPYIPKAETSANTQQGLSGKSKFTYDSGKDVYVCPAGSELTCRFATYELGRGLRYYRATGCQDCQLKAHCPREANEHLREAMAPGCKHSRRSSS